MIDISWLTLLLGVVLPMLTALVTKQVASPGLKAVILAFLAAVAGVVQELISVSGDWLALDWNAVAANAVTTFLVAVGLHFGLLKPTGMTGADGGIQRAVPGGVGSGSPRHAA